MKQLQAKNFYSRQSLDDYVKNELGDDIQANRMAGHTIFGTDEELRLLGLSSSVRVYGVKVLQV